MIEITQDTAQKFIIEEQGLGVTKSFENVHEVAKKIHNIQIDTISVVARSHDLILFNRLPKYQEKEVWNWQKEKKLFEFWSHAMCLMPFEEYPFYAWMIEYYKDNLPSWWKNWAAKNPDAVDRVYKYVKKNGPTASSDFKRERERKSEGWWDWKVEKMALECLFLNGKLLVSHRKNFQKTYDLTENVLPSNIDIEPIDSELLPRYLTKTIFNSMGIGNGEEIKSYLGKPASKYLWKGNRKAIENYLKECVNDDFLVEIQINGIDNPQYILKEKLPILDTILGINYEKSFVKFLTPFDNITRERSYPEKIWNFAYKIECYVPAPKRIFGYFALPILDGYQLIGKADLKAHRTKQILEVKALAFEKGIDLDEVRAERLSLGFNNFAKFNGCNKIEFASTVPKSIKNKLSIS